MSHLGSPVWMVGLTPKPSQTGASLSAELALRDSGSFIQTMSFVRMFKRGDIFRTCCESLQHHPEGLDTSELALICLKANGLDDSDKLLRRSMAQSIIQLMTGRRERGEIVSTEKRGVARIWKLPVL